MFALEKFALEKFALEKRRLFTVALVIALLFALFYMLRIVFLLGFSGVGSVVEVAPAVLTRALYIGAKFDLRLALLCGIPVVIMAYAPRISLFASARVRNILLCYLAIATFLLLMFYSFDFGHYDYLARRIDSTVIRFAGDVEISAEMLWQSYPIVQILLAVIATSLAWFWLYRWALNTSPVAPLVTTRKAYAVSLVTCLVLVSMGIFGRLGTQVPLRWSEAFFVDDEAVAAVALNPVLYFFDTFKNREDTPDRGQVEKHYALVAEYLGVDEPDSGSLNFTRSVPGNPGKKRPNVVFIMLESLGAVRLGVFGNPLKPSPVLDRLAREGLFFPNFFVPASGTARTVFASITGLPDVSRVETATRNPLITEQHTIINHFEGYRKFFFTGGSASWANMRALIKHNIPDLELHEEGSYTEPSIDVWGISDLSLFREVDAVLSKVPTDQPFFAYVQTAGNHRPFTIPEDNDGFEASALEEEAVRAHGFTTTAQYNAVRFLDHVIGRFMEMAEQSEYLDNTIFVMFGDHNNRITTLPHMPPSYERLDLESLLVPFIIYAPGLLEPARHEQTMSLVDVLPTVAGLAGIGYRNTTLGRDALADDQSLDRWVYVQRESKRAPRIGVVNRDYLLRMRFDGGEVELHNLAASNPELNIGPEHPEMTERHSRLARGLYETTKYMMYNNPRRTPP